MKCEVKKGDDFKLIDYKFKSLLEMLSFIEEHKPITYSNASESGDYDFTGTSSFQEAFDMCKNGVFSKDVEEFQKIFFKLANQVNKKLKLIKVKHDVVGAAPDVPMYLKGHPLNMLNIEQKKAGKKPKKIYLRFNSAISASTSKKIIENRGLAFVLMFDLLRKLGLPVELQTSEFSESNSVYVNTEVPLLQNNDMINISKIYFPLVHPSYLRRIMFALEERMPELQSHQHYFRGYGSPTSYREYFNMTDKELHENEINIFSDDFNYKSLQGALKSIIKQIGAEGGLKTSTEQILELIDSIDFSSLHEFDDSDYGLY